MCAGFLHSILRKFRKDRPNDEVGYDDGTPEPLHPPERPVTATWDLRISDGDLAKLIKGFQPEVMEDRWVVAASEPDQQGNIDVRMTRSWTGQEVYKFKISTKGHGNGAKDEPRIVEITWDQNVKESEAEAKESAGMLCKALLDCELNYLAKATP